MTGKVQSARSKTGIINYTYNKAGLLIKQEDVNAGETTFFVYDKAGRRTRMDSGNREVFYRYGKVGELLSIVDNKQRMSVNYVYDERYREIERQLGNGVVQKTEYTSNGKTEIIKEINARGELLRAEAYVYDEKDRRIFTVNEKGLLTSYFYDAQSRLQKVLYPYTEEKRAADKAEAQEEGLFFIEGNIKAVNYFLNQKEKSALSRVLEKISYGRSNYLTTTQVQWEERYTYDANGNRASKTTTFGTIRYWYDAENRLIHSGSDSARGSDYTYDANGNLMSKKNLYKTEEYEYNLTNRMSMSTVTDHIKKTKTITHYDYDAFGRRTLVQDEGGKIIRTLYDGLSFDIIREQETFADGYFTNTSDTGIAWGAVSEGDGSRYRYIGDDAPAAKEQNGYSVTATNRASSRVALYANGQAVGVTRSSNYASSERSYFGTDLMGTVRSSTTDSGNAEYYEYDVFGKPYGESVSDYAYTGKPYDPTTGMYNYGYRDYIPEVARFSTVDPIRDGSNWFAYCNNEPVNFRDLWGLELTLTVDKDNQSISVYYKHENGAVYMSSGKGSVTTGVVSHDTKPNSDTSRTQDSGGVKTNPTQFPNGEHKITGTKSNPYDDKKYGEIWITTDATQDLPIVDPKTGEKTDKTVNDGGYQIHLTTNSNTNGCIGILDKKVMEMLISFVKLNERLYPSTSKIVVKGGKND